MNDLTEGAAHWFSLGILIPRTFLKALEGLCLRSSFSALHDRTGAKRSADQRSRPSSRSRKALDYDNCSFSIYKNNDAIATAGKISPTSGTRIDGRFKLIIYILKNLGAESKNLQDFFRPCSWV